MLSNTAEYALRAVIYVAEQRDRSPVRVGEAAERLGIPRNYLSKIFHELARLGVLTSTRGKHGGFRLARDPAETSLLDIVGCFDQMSERQRCLLGRPQCSDRNACRVHAHWKHLSAELADFFRTTTLADLMHGDPAAA